MQLPGLTPDAQGKVRDIFDLGDELLIVATDRISAFDVVLPDPIPYKGEVLTKISLFWFDHLKDVVASHLISADVRDLPEQYAEYAEALKGRMMLVRKAQVFPVECIVRGYLAGSGWNEYREHGTVCGQKLPAGLVESDRLPEPIFTPSTKAAIGEHDENISFERMCEIIGEEHATRLRDVSLELYSRAAEHARSCGIIIADTKFEFGLIDGEVALIDEVLTPDSSRFWPADSYEPGHGQPSFDKQFVRDWLEASGWDKKPPAPSLPEDVIVMTAEKYVEAYEAITGEPFVPENE
ncbi:phosphoribosylaminoimidazolesuccinocarboxamide synthase [Coriobacteriia bacterium Es71-Z0120]|uniref:phosphoribosylaminoimidazolesuccinocarboxamide synthase n=1 Tax=Parvivirga hydrogeniphila TaxID=2939460 RepID=UPI0022609271|nr:phosphoribosylaminoimidazolesuccinocarboxamide synthase [Parvivirga hydrogeniphila]MCL4078040.1 phosphoribosylaminoimidazolesuccinocarboxamide synthase [Parvivirga hydrogeniphila]